MPRSRKALTYRLRRLPAYLERSTVADFLAGSIEGLGPPENIVIFSLASNLVHWERPPTKTATLMFKKTPERFDNDRIEWTVSLPNQSQSLIFDTHFLEFTPLSDCDRNMHQFDCIAIPGLASHPLGSWMHRDPDTNFVWLRDRLPRDMPAIRPILYGYDTQLVKSESVQTIDDLASSFIARLKSVGRALVSAKPLIIIAHSLGGILLRRALIQLANSGGEEKFMLKSIKMIFFFGVPSKGMHMSHMLPMVEDHPNQYLVQSLSPDSDYLSSLSQHFSNIATLHNIRLISAYETKRSRTTKKSEVGIWEREGPHELLVDQQSAVQADSSPQDCFPINEDHSDMVKFSDDSPEYRIVIRFFDTLFHTTPSDSKPLLGSEQPRSNNPQDSSRRHKSKGPKIFKDRASAFNANSSLYELGSQAESSSKKHQRRKGRKAAADTGTSTHEAISQHEKTERQNNLKELRDSLEFEEQSQRYESITEAHQTTFDWIFEKSDLGLVSWLRKGTGIYWIQGKPGSGKSTLMKFLHGNPRTSEILNQWRQGRDHMSAWFFFNERGSYVQKSFEGLFRSVIGQLITTNERLAELVLDIYLERVKKSSKENQTWHIQDLELGLSTILSQRQQDLEVLFFLDALDEYSGPPEMIADFVQSLTQPATDSRTHVKVLFSSRPWNSFVAGFSQCPGFKMHEQTKGDMRLFVLDQLSTIHSITSSSSAGHSVDSKPRDVVSNIVDRAEGVFLWVRLVVESLLNAGPDTTTSQLERQLLAFPNGLEKLYEGIIERIPRSSRLDAFVVIEIVNRAFTPLSIKQVVLAASCALGKTHNECVEMIKNKSLGMNNEQEALHIKNLCGGLIETNVQLNKNTPVHFMHQTVKDFVNRPGFERRMLGRSHAPLYENGYTFLMKYYLALHELAPQRDFENLLWSARNAEETTGNNQEEFLDSIRDEYFFKSFESQIFSGLKFQPNSVLSFAVLGNLVLYITKKLHSTKVVNDTAQKSLMHFAIESTFLEHPPSSQTRMLRLLFDRGANIDHGFAGVTPFQFLLNLFGGRTQRSVFERSIARVIEVLLEHGQDVNADVPDTWYHTGGFRRVAMCKALHLTLGEASRTLLEHGAHVNALDSRGSTALDRVILGEDRFHLGGPTREATALILLEHGGCVARSTKAELRRFLSSPLLPNLQPDNLHNPPRLPLTFVRRVRGIVPVYLGGYRSHPQSRLVPFPWGEERINLKEPNTHVKNYNKHLTSLRARLNPI